MYKIGICDDEKSTSAEIEKFLLDSAEKNAIQFDINVWFSGESLCQYLKTYNDLDLIFLDIQLYQISGIDVGNFIRNEMNNIKTSIIFISHKKGYALKLFKMQPIDFLVKPICKEQIDDVIKIFLKYKSNQNDYFEYKKGFDFYKISFDEIIYFRSDNRKIEIVTSKGVENYYGKLINILDLVPKKFIQINQSFIINQDYAKIFLYEQVTMKNGDVLSISRGFRKLVREKIKKYTLKYE